MQDDILHVLNTEQINAVKHEEGPLLIFAGAGSGKTRVIVHRVAYLIRRGVKPDRILCLTFTNKAASEMKQRLMTIVGTSSHRIWAGTFHSFGAWFLRREASKIGYTNDFVIYDESDQKALIAQCMKDLKINRENRAEGIIAWMISMSKDTLRDIDSFDIKLGIDPRPVIQLYEEKKRLSNAFDFGDLLLKPMQILHEHPGLRERYQSMFQHILVDEYQDTNKAQYTLLMGLVGKDKNICVVGDDDQSIYSWRGADVSNILRFKEDFPDARIVTLEQNYRSPQSILDAASKLIANNQFRAPKKLWSDRRENGAIVITEYEDDEAEAEDIAYSIRKLLDSGVDPGNIAVFYRINALSRVIEEAFVQENIPYSVYGGTRFYERREIKDVLAYLRLVANPRDESALTRIINRPSRGIGIKTLDILRGLAKSKGISVIDAMEKALEKGLVKGAGARGIKTFMHIMDDLMQGLSGVEDIADLIARIIKVSGLENALEAEIDGPDRLTNIKELEANARGKVNLVSFLEEKALITSMDMDKGKDSVSVMTLHMSKGLEFDHVFIMGLEDGLLPHSRSMETDHALEEERRLLYVGMTRARKKAYLSWARVRALYGKEIYQLPSGFIHEIVS